MSGQEADRQRIQRLSRELQELEAQREVLMGEIQALQEEKRDIDDAIEAIEALETGSTVQVPLGGETFVRAEIQDVDEVIVGLGGGYAAEQEQDRAIETLENKQASLDERIEELRAEVSEIDSETEELEAEAQEVSQLAMQQLQQMQGEGEGL